MTIPSARRAAEASGRRAQTPLRQRTLLRLVAAAAVVGLCVALKAPLDWIAGAPLPPFITLYPAVVAAALVGGTAAGVASVGVGLVVAWFLWLAPEQSFAIADRETAVGLVLFAGSATMIAVVVGHIGRMQEEMRRQGTFLRTLLDASQSCIAVAERSEEGAIRFRLVNRAFEELNPGTPMVGNAIRKALGPGGERLEADISRVLATGTAHQALGVAIPTAGRADATYDEQITRLPASSGEAPSALVVAWETTEHARAERALKESENRLTELAESMPQLVWRARDDGRIDYYNSRLAFYVGAERLGSGDWSWEGLLHPDDLVPTGEAWAAAVASRAEFQAMHRLRMADGAWRWHLSRARPVRDADGVTHWYGTATDIHDRVEAEEKVRVLLAEVNHRAKNMLALVQAVARQTVKGEPQDFLQRFERRMQALAASQDLLVSSGWEGIDLGDLVRAQLAHFADLIGTRITLSGPTVTLKSAAAQSLGIALHELSTNAGKYGALSGAEGSVAIAWDLAGGAADTLTISWTERGGPPVAAPVRRGFGSHVTGRMVEAALGGKVETRFDPDGFSWRLHCRGERALEAPPQPPAPAAGAEVRARILVVEDEALVALEIAALLEDSGFVVVGPAASVSAALELLSRGPCDAAVLDVNLGAETSEPIAEQLIEGDVPFVTVSGYSPSQRPSTFGGAPFFGKPLTRPELLVAELRSCLVARRRRADVARATTREGRVVVSGPSAGTRTG